MPDSKSTAEFRTDERVLVRVGGSWTTARYIRRQRDRTHFVHVNATHGAVTVTDEDIRRLEDEQ